MGAKAIGVVYLCRANEEKESFSNFVNSYKKFPANCNHELIIIFKGFQDCLASYLSEVQAIFSGLDYRAIYLPDEGFDIGAYLETAKIMDHQYLLFFNTYTVIVANGWLGYLYSTINHDNVGIVGTTASYESIFSSNFLMHRFSNFYYTGDFKDDPHVLSYYQSLVTVIDPKNEPFKRLRRSIKLRIRRFFKKIFGKNDSNIDINRHIAYLKKVYGEFPNPHIRSNGFMISRELLLSLFGDYKVRTKEDACNFESGPRGLSRKIWELGMKTLLVGRNGVAYDVKDWPKSNTFRLGTQENLLTSDNQTRNYDNFSKKEKLVHSWISWGNDVINSEVEFPRLGFSFDTTPLTDMHADEKDQS